jgi:hypothetical protein
VAVCYHAIVECAAINLFWVAFNLRLAQFYRGIPQTITPSSSRIVMGVAQGNEMAAGMEDSEKFMPYVECNFQRFVAPHSTMARFPLCY